MRLLLFVLVAATISLALADGKNRTEEDDKGGTAGGFYATTGCYCKDPLRLATLNAWQAPYTIYREPRIESFAKQLELGRFDVVCVQGMWDNTQARKFSDDLRDTYPYSFRSNVTAKRTCTGRCSAPEIESTLQCSYVKRCPLEPKGGDFIRCLEDRCSGQYKGLSSDCRKCLEDDVSSGSFKEDIGACIGGSSSETHVPDSGDVEVFSSCQPLYGGNTDTLILSKWRIRDSDTLIFDVNPLATWSALYAKVEYPGFEGGVPVFCASLVGDEFVSLDLRPENRLQTEQLLHWVNAKSGHDKSAFLMGSFGFGPEIEGRQTENVDEIDEVWEETYFFVQQSGWSDASVIYNQTAGGTISCTLCGKDVNPLSTQVIDPAKVDAIWVKNTAPLCPANVTTAFQRQDIPVDSFKGTSFISPSSHFGVSAQFCRTKTGAIGDIVLSNASSLVFLSCLSFVALCVVLLL